MAIYEKVEREIYDGKKIGNYRRKITETC